MINQARFWSSRAKHYDSEITKHTKDYRQTLSCVKALLTEDDIVLDFGCGSGEYAIAISKHVKKIVGIDTSREMISLARKKINKHELENIRFNHINIFDLRSGDFSVVLALNIFHLVDDIDQIIACISKLLPVNGLLVCQTPCLGERKWVFRFLILLLQKIKVSPPILDLTYGVLKGKIVLNGFKILEERVWNKRSTTNWIVAIKV